VAQLHFFSLLDAPLVTFASRCRFSSLAELVRCCSSPIAMHHAADELLRSAAPRLLSRSCSSIAVRRTSSSLSLVIRCVGCFSSSAIGACAPPCPRRFDSLGGQLLVFGGRQCLWCCPRSLVGRIVDAQPSATNSVRKDHPLFYRNLYSSLLAAIHDVWFSKFSVQDGIAALAGASLTSLKHTCGKTMLIRCRLIHIFVA
jgi:hypothetical protein